jgi:uncharacterized protein (DUF2236 family)
MGPMRRPQLRGPGEPPVGGACPLGFDAHLRPSRQNEAHGCRATSRPQPTDLPDQGERELLTRVHREHVVCLGYGAALLLHAADPRIAQAVADHSVFLRKPARRLERLYSTGDTMFFLLFGTPYEKRHAADRLNRLHDRITGTLPEDYPTLPAGTPYAAHDPALALWVHVSLHATLLDVYEDLVGPLESEERDRYCREAAAIEPLLRLTAGTLPRDAATLRARFAAGVLHLAVGGPGRRIVRGILNPPHPWWAEPLVVLTRLWTVGLLPPPVRVAYGLHWGWGREAAFRLSRRLIRGLLPHLPERLRRVPPEIFARTRALAGLESRYGLACQPLQRGVCAD